MDKMHLHRIKWIGYLDRISEEINTQLLSVYVHREGEKLIDAVIEFGVGESVWVIRTGNGMRHLEYLDWS
jgi:hypothetical protein